MNKEATALIIPCNTPECDSSEYFIIKSDEGIYQCARCMTVFKILLQYKVIERSRLPTSGKYRFDHFVPSRSGSLFPYH